MQKQSIYFFSYLLLIISLNSCGIFRKAEKNKTKAEASFYKQYSEKLGYTLTGNENPALIKEIGEWIGTPYKYGGCDKSGTDCSCFVKNVYKNVYGMYVARSTSDIMNDVRKINKSQLQEGDLVFFKTGKKVSHVGIYISKNKFVHASSSKGVMISDLDNSYWLKTYVKSGRLIR